MDAGCDPPRAAQLAHTILCWRRWSAYACSSSTSCVRSRTGSRCLPRHSTNCSNTSASARWRLSERWSRRRKEIRRWQRQLGPQRDDHLAAEPAHLYLCCDLRRDHSDGSVDLRSAFVSSVRRCSGITRRSMSRTSIFGSFSRTHRSQYRMLFLTGPGKKPSPAMNDDVVQWKDSGARRSHHPSGTFSGCASAWQ